MNRMSEVFELPMVVDGYSVESQPSIPIGCVAEYVSGIKCDSGKDAEYVAHAINNHDRLIDENARLREMVKALESGLTNALETKVNISSKISDKPAYIVSATEIEKLLNKDTK